MARIFERVGELIGGSRAQTLDGDIEIQDRPVVYQDEIDTTVDFILDDSRSELEAGQISIETVVRQSVLDGIALTGARIITIDEGTGE